MGIIASNVFTLAIVKDGENGIGIESTIIHYQTSNSGTVIPTGTWSTSIPSVSAGQYLWTRLTINYSDETTDYSYSVSRNGTNGTDGDDGRGIKSTAITYQASSSGTTVPTGTWTTSIPTVLENQYLWTRTIITYTDDTTSTSYSVGKMGATGEKGDTGVGVAKVDVYYYLSSSSTSLSGGSWNTTDPGWVDGKYIWSKTVVTYTDNSTTSTEAVCITGAKGDTGDTGNGISTIVEYYYQSSSATTLSGGTWSPTYPGWVNGKYIWTKSIITYTNNTSVETTPICVTGAKGDTGQDGTSSYLFTRYSSTESPHLDMYEVPTDDTLYIGTYISSVNSPSTNPSDYNWVKYREDTLSLNISADNGTSFSNDGTLVSLTATGKLGQKTVTGTYQWFKDGTAISGATKNTYSVKCTGLKVHTIFKCTMTYNDATASDDITIQNTVAILYGETNPYEGDSTIYEGSIWIDTSNGNDSKVYKRYNGSSWVTITEAQYYEYVGYGEGRTTIFTTTKLKQTADEIAAVASRVTVNETTIKENYTEFKTTADEIKSSVTDLESDVSGLDTRITNNTTNITQNANSITSLAKRVTTNETNISENYSELKQTADNISSEVNSIQTDIDDLDNRTTSNTTKIEQNAKDITLISSSVEENTQAITDNYAELKLADTNITSQVSQIKTDLSELDKEVESNTTKITQNANSITSLASRTTTVENKFGNYSTTEEMNSAIEQSATSIKSTVSATYATKSDLETTNANVTTAQNTADAAQKQIYHSASDADGTSGYVGFVTITVKSNYMNRPVLFGLSNRGTQSSNVSFMLTNANNTDPALSHIQCDGGMGIWAYKSDTSTWIIIAKKSESYDTIYVNDFSNPNGTGLAVEWSNILYTELPTSNITAATVLAGKIAKSTIDTMSTNITQNATDITALAKRVTTNETSISNNYSELKQTADSISSEVSSIQTDIDDLDTRVTSNTTKVTQTATQLSWIVKSGTSSSSMVLTDDALTIIANNINLTGKVTYAFLSSDAQQKITNAQTTADTANTNALNALENIDNLKIGGRNLIKNSNFFDGYNKWAGTGVTMNVEEDDEFEHCLVFSATSAGSSSYRVYTSIETNFTHVKGTEYTLSFYAKASEAATLQSNVAGANNQQNYSVTTEWQRFSYTYTASATGSLTFWSVSANITMYITNIMLEESNKASDWVPAPEDINDNIDSNISDVQAVIVEQSTTLEKTCQEIVAQATSSYTTLTDFEAYKEEVTSSFTQTSSNITLSFEKISSLESVTKSHDGQIETINSYFDFGNDGLIIGESNSPYQMQLTNTQLNMLLNKDPVMWIDATTKEIYTPIIKITVSMNLFGFTATEDSDGNINWDYTG